MEWIRQWLIGITAAAMLQCVANSLMPKGVVRQAGKLTGGLVMLLAFLSPIYQLDLPSMEAGIYTVWDMEKNRQEPLEEFQSYSYLRKVIERECAAYIQDKAKEKDIICQVIVTCGGDSDGYPYPTEVTIKGEWNEDQRRWIEAEVEDALGVAPDDQIYCWMEGESGD